MTFLDINFVAPKPVSSPRIAASGGGNVSHDLINFKHLNFKCNSTECQFLFDRLMM